MYICVFMTCSHSAVFMTIRDQWIVCMLSTALSVPYHVQNANRRAGCQIFTHYGTHVRSTVLDLEANAMVREITSR